MSKHYPVKLENGKMKNDIRLSHDEECISFRIASHRMQLVVPAGAFAWQTLLPSFKPFECDSTGVDNAMCSIRVVDQPIGINQESAVVLNEISGMVGHSFCLMETDQHYLIDIQFIENGSHYHMLSDKNFSTAIVYADWNDVYAGIVLSTFLMFAFTQSAVLHRTLLIHASVVEKDGEGYAFLGKSGTGKSTHSALWLQYIKGAALLNDDNPAIHIEDGGVFVYGTPWSGKCPCYKNRKVRLKALIRLEQAPVNRFKWLKGVEAYVTFLPSCSSMRWNSQLFNAMCTLMEEVIANVNVGSLDCLPDKEAVYLCYEEIEKV
ncbi:MAG: phosphoenolpyruvate carboxykinase [Tannerella sp.]|jgi:hypothetical protein|nr:phosphoenolpyruvate carboxykinase [Tannerella sp.]